MERVTRIFSAVLLALLYAVLVYRAATNPITVDEGYIYYRYIHDIPTSEVFTAPYHSANHVLQTLLSCLAVKSFGVSELMIRVPTLVMKRPQAGYRIAMCM